jgi:hypothetical protein
MKFKIGDHLQDIGSYVNGIVINIDDEQKFSSHFWYLLENDELGLLNYWLPETKLELHKQTLRNNKLEELGI